MGYLDNIQASVEKGIQAFGQTFTPMYIKGIETANRIQLENYLMQKRLEMELQQYKAKRDYVLKQKTESEIARIQALNLTEIAERNNDIDNSTSNLLKMIAKSYKIDLSPDELQNPDVAIQKIMQLPDIDQKAKLRVLDIYKKRNVHKMAVLKEQMNKIETALQDENLDPIKKAGYITAYNQVSEAYNNLMQASEKLTDAEADLVSNVAQKYKTSLALGQQVVATDLGRIKLDIQKGKLDPKIAYETINQYLGVLDKYNFGTSQYKNQLNKIMQDKELSPIEKSITMLNMIDAINTDLKLMSLFARIQKTGSLSESDLYTLQDIANNVQEIMGRYPYNPEVATVGRQILGILQSKDIDKTKLQKLRALNKQLGRKVKEAEDEFSKNRSAVEKIGKSMIGYFKDITDLLPNDIKNLAEEVKVGYTKLSAMLTDGDIDRGFLESYIEKVKKLNEYATNPKNKSLFPDDKARRFTAFYTKQFLQSLQKAMGSLAIVSSKITPKEQKAKQKVEVYREPTQEELDKAYEEAVFGYQEEEQPSYGDMLEELE